MDAEAHEFLYQKKGRIFYKPVEEEGGLYLRFYTADLADVKGCADCHAKLKKTAFNVGDMLGIRQFKLLFSEDIAAGKARLNPSKTEYYAIHAMFTQTLSIMEDGGRYAIDATMEGYKPFSGLTDKAMLAKISEIKEALSTFDDAVVSLEKSAVGSNEFWKAQQMVQTVSNALRAQSNDLVNMFTEIANANQKYIQISFTVMAVVVIVSFIAISLFISRSILAPLNRLTDVARTISGGDLTREADAVSSDEMGEMAQAFNNMIHSLREMVKGIQHTSTEIAAVSERTASTAEGLSTGADMQSSSVENTSSCIGQMNDSIKEIAKSTSDLAVRASNANGSVIEIVAAIEQVAGFAGELSVSADESSSSITEMTTSITEIANLASQLSEHTSETVSAVAEIDRSIQETSNSIKISAEISEGNVRDAEAGGDAVKTTIQSMEKIQEIVQRTADRIKKLGEKSVAIGNILNVINEITEETNLLSLNAAIIAAQAGVHGRGFAVVADQIKSLSKKTKLSTREIEGLIKPVQSEASQAVTAMEAGASAVEEGVKLSQRAGNALDKILESANSSVSIHQRIQTASSEQLKGSRYASEAMEKIMNMLSRVYQAIEEQQEGTIYISRAAEKMKESARQVKDATKKQSHEGEQVQAAIEEMNNVTMTINRATQEQAKGSAQLLYAAEETRVIADENMSSVKEMKEISKILVTQADTLEDIVGKFKV